MQVNGHEAVVAPAADTTLLDMLRTTLGLTGAKRGCGVGECGACTVLLDGRPQLACITLAGRVAGSSVETVEGLAEEFAGLREAFSDEGAFQCGFCTPGFITMAAALLRAGLPPEDAELRRLLSGNICRCTGYDGIVRAIRKEENRRAAE